MSRDDKRRVRRPGAWEATAPALSEEESHREHRAALEATLFRKRASEDEVVLELAEGQLRIFTRVG